MNRAGLLGALRVGALRASFPLAFLLLVFLLPGTASCLHAQSAGKLYKMGQKAEAAENWDAAFNDYQEAHQKKPDDLRYRTSLLRIRLTAASAHLKQGRQYEQSGNYQGAMVELLRANEIDPSDEAITQEMARVRQSQQAVERRRQPAPPPESAEQQELDSMGGPVELKPVSSEPLTLHMTEDSKIVYQAVGRAAGINVLFDPDYHSQRIQVDLNNVSLLDALRIVAIQSNTFWQPVTPNTIFVAQNNLMKQRDFAQQAVQTFYLTNAWQPNDLQDTVQAVRNLLGTSVKVQPIASQNAVVVRGTPDELMLAQKIINDTDKPMPEVVVDIAIMEVSKNWERTLGLEWPGSVGVQLESPTSTSSSSSSSSTDTTTTDNLTLYNLANLNSNDFAITMGAATANLLLSDTNTKILQNPRLRATNMQKATMKIGERIPIATGSFSTGASASVLGGYAETQFQYIDIGVNIEMTPIIHADGDVTLKLNLEDKSEGGNVTISGVTEPIIIQKTSEQTIRLREGEVSILGGILENSDTTSWNGIPGLSSVPILRYLFGSKDHTIQTDELVFMLVPHIVRSADISAQNLRPVDTGTGQNVQVRMLPTSAPAAYAAPVVQTGVARTTIGQYRGMSAAAAATQALADMRRTANGQLANPVPQPAMQRAAAAQVAAAPAPGSELRFLLNNPGPVARGSTFQVPVVVSGAQDIDSVPLRMHYDASKLALVNVAPGDFLGRGGQAIQPSVRDDGGNLTINASRPAGAAGVNGAGVVYVLTFQAKASGPSAITITQPGAMTSKQRLVPASAGALNLVVK